MAVTEMDVDRPDAVVDVAVVDDGTNVVEVWTTVVTVIGRDVFGALEVAAVELEVVMEEAGLDDEGAADDDDPPPIASRMLKMGLMLPLSPNRMRM